MSEAAAIVSTLRANWSMPRTAWQKGAPVAVPLRCTFMQSAPEAELQFVAAQIEVPPEVLDFWRETDGARLFEDEQFGQWGLRLFSASEALERTFQFAQERPDDFRRGDLTLGEFLGDSDLLIVRCDPSEASFGSILIALPMDVRADWDRASPGLVSFLSRYAETHGEKFWRVSSASEDK